VPVFAKVKVHRDFHVEIGRALYSAPKQYLGCYLDARADSVLVKLFCHGQLVKTHPRQQPGRLQSRHRPAPQTLRHALDHPRCRQHRHPALPGSQQPLGRNLAAAQQPGAAR